MKRNTFAIVMLALSGMGAMFLSNKIDKANLEAKLAYAKWELPAGFPVRGFFPGATLTKSTSIKRGNGTRYLAEWTAKGNVEEIGNWHDKLFLQQGWVLVIPRGQDQPTNIYYAEYRKGDEILQLSVVGRLDIQEAQIEVIIHPLPMEEEENE